jgi:uncharacterized LabA/DUF88 family protein
MTVRVGVYIDGFNLYYGGRALMGGAGQPGWRWLDLRRLATRIVASRSGWPEPVIARVVYCTARIDGASNHDGARDQEIYLRALRATQSVDVIEFGRYVSRVVYSPLAVKDAVGQPVIVRADWPVKIRDQAGQPVPNGSFVVSVLRREEKGTDVNLASHLLLDLFNRRIDAAVIVSNDSDLVFPVAEAGKLIPVGVVNPTRNMLVGALRGRPTHGVGGHWWYQINGADLVSAQLPTRIGRITMPPGW